MALRPCTAINQADVATLLHGRFGSLRHWRDFLADCIRDRASINGLQLLPIGYVRAKGKSRRPVYDLATVEEFIARVAAVASPLPVRPFSVLVDRSLPLAMRRVEIVPMAPASPGFP